MKSKIFLFPVMLAVALLSGCASGPQPPAEAPPLPGYSEVPSPQAEALWRQAEQAQKTGNTAQAANLWERIVQSYPNNAMAARALGRLGSFYLEQGQAERALQYFDYLLYTYPRWSGVNQAKLDRLRALYAAGRKKEVERDAMPLWDAAAGQAEVQAGLGALMTDFYASQGDFETAFDWASAGFSVARSPQENKALTEATLRLLGGLKEGGVKKLFKKNPTDFMRVFLEYRLVQIDTEKGQGDAGKERLRALLAQNPSHPLNGQIQTSIRGTRTAAEPGARVNPGVVGCLLPLNGPYAKYGDVVMKGLNLAANDWNEKHPSEQVTLVVKDTQTEPESAARSFEELVKKDSPVAVIGPLGAQQAAAVIPAANKSGVPLLTLTQKEEGAGDDSFVVHVFLDNRQMIKTLVRYCREKLGLTRFAALYPEDRYGQKISKVFAEVVQELGGNLLASVSYKQKTTDFKEPITKLMTIAKKNAPPSGTETTPFEALFLPDQVQTVSMIAPQLPYNNVVGVTLLGTNLWSEGPIAQAGDVYLDQALFATPYYPDSQSPRVRSFREKYEAAYQATPSYLEAQAYDALTLLLQARSNLPSGAADRSQLMQSLLGMKGFQGVAGVYSFDPNGDLERNYQLLQVSNGQVVQVSAP